MDDRELIRQTLGKASFFSGISFDLLEHFVEASSVQRYEEGAIICQKGDPGDTIYVVVDGEARVHEGPLIFTTLSKGDTFGELAAFENKPRTASITVSQDLTAVCVERDPIVEIMSNHPDSGLAIVQSLCRCLRERTEEVIDGALSRVRMERELQIGRKIQSGFIPGSLPDLPGWTLSAHFEAAKEVAGDFYDVFTVDGHNRIGLIIADVCDKGVGAALFMTLFRSLLRSTAKMGEYTELPEGARGQGAEAPQDLLRRCVQFTNNYIAATHGHTSMFATLFFGLLDPDTGHLYYINAGHEEPFILTSGGVRGNLENSGPVVGLFQNSVYQVFESQIEKGETLFAYTDGVPDAIDEGEDPFSLSRLIPLLEAKPAENLVQSVVGNIREHIGGAPQFDDITILAVSRE